MYSLDPAQDKPDKLSLVLEPKLKPTFLYNPVDVNGAPTKWDPKELSFTKASLWAPKSFSKTMPKRLPIHINDPVTKSFFSEDQFFTTSKKISLPTGVFSPASVLLNNSEEKSCSQEFWGRQGVIDAEITCQLLEFSQDRLGEIEQTLNSLTFQTETKSSMDKVRRSISLLSNLNKLALQSNYRQRSWSIQSCVKASQDLRSYVLNFYKGDDTTREYLLHSGFLSEDLFGPLPEHIAKPNPNSCSNRVAHMVGSAQSSSQSNKRQMPNRQSSSSKRGKTPVQKPFVDWAKDSKVESPFGKDSARSQRDFARGGKNFRKQRGRGKRGSR